MIYLFTGQPHSGKTTLAKWLRKAILESNPSKEVFHVDGDDLRRINKNKDYSEQGRKINIGQGFAIAKYLDEYARYHVILSMVAPYKEMRDELKENAEVIEIYVHTKEIRGRENFHVENYQPPTNDYIDIDTTNVSEFESLNELLEKIQEHLKIKQQQKNENKRKF
jgi:adenylylsulfate kinase-like enzyme